MSHIQNLYQEMILEHNRNPRNFKKLDSCSHHSHGINPLCGDDYHLYIKMEDNVIIDVGFEGQGCAISKSSGSLMSAAIKGKTAEEALSVKFAFMQLMKDELDLEGIKQLGKLKIFEGVKQFPVRVKCATLIWHALQDALDEKSLGQVTTENQMEIGRAHV